MAGRIFASIGIAVVGMLISGALSESFGPTVMIIGLTLTAVLIFIVWGKMKNSQEKAQ